VQCIKVRSISAEHMGLAVAFRSLQQSCWAGMLFGHVNSSKLLQTHPTLTSTAEGSAMIYSNIC